MLAQKGTSIIELGAVPGADTRLPAAQRHPTVWGLQPVQLHDRFWASRGVFVARLGERQEVPRDAEVFLLTDAQTLALFRLGTVIDTMSWVKPAVMFLRLASKHEQEYRERIITNEDGRFVRFKRLYGGMRSQVTRLALTRDPNVAFAWTNGEGEARAAWKVLRQEARGSCYETALVRGRAYDRRSEEQVAGFALELVRQWAQPSTTIADIKEAPRHVWAARGGSLAKDVHFVGSVWVGAGRAVEPGSTVLGPAILWDDPEVRPAPSSLRWSELEPAKIAAVARRTIGPGNRRAPFGKRAFDFVFALGVLLLILPIFPIIMLAIWFEDGRPIFFAHRRETMGGREFPCIKFRSMRRDAEQVRRQLQQSNQADGPQFYIKKDPRLTRVGAFIRKTNIDELPQFFNILLGHMSLVGPRPSPRAENQYSPAWREARLGVRAGLTGLWQISRTRRPGLDFQEWIKYDLEYIQKMSWRLDLRIILRTIRVILRGI